MMSPVEAKHLKRSGIAGALLSAAVILAAPLGVQAQQNGGESAAAAEETKPPEKVKTGVIASVGTYSQPTAIDVETGDAAPGDETNPIQAGISIVGSNNCEARVFNASEENTYAVRFRVVGINSAGNRVVNRSFSASLKPKEAETRRVACRSDYRMQVELVSARKR